MNNLISNNKNVQIKKQSGHIIAHYLPDENDTINSFYDVKDMESISYTQPFTSTFSFLGRWLTNKFVLVIMAVFSLTAVLQGSKSPILQWIGDSVLGKSFNFILYTTKAGQEITVAMSLFLTYLAYFTFSQLLRIPHELEQQRYNDNLHAEKEVLRRVREWRAAKLEAFNFNQKLQEQANKLLEKQIEINKQTRAILKKALPDHAELDDEKINDTLFSVLREEFTKKKPLDILNRV